MHIGRTSGPEAVENTLLLSFSVHMQNRRKNFYSVMELTHDKSLRISMGVNLRVQAVWQNRTDHIRCKVQKTYYCSDGSCTKMCLYFMSSKGTSNAFEEDPAIFTFIKGLY